MTSFMWTWNVPNNDFAALRAFDVDVVRAGDLANTTALDAMLAAAHAAGVKLLVPLYTWTYVVNDGRSPKVYTQAELDALTAKLQPYAEHPDIYGWQTYDEPSVGLRFPNTARIQMYQHIKSLSSKPVGEVDYRIYPGYYSPDSHDFFAWDGYCMAYTGSVVHAADASGATYPYGCISPTTGEVADAAKYAQAINQYGVNAAYVAGQLSTNGDVGFPLMQGAHTDYAVEAWLGPIPAAAFAAMWQKIQTNWPATIGAGFWGWDFDYLSYNAVPRQPVYAIGLNDRNRGPFMYTDAERNAAKAVMTATKAAPGVVAGPWRFDLQLALDESPVDNVTTLFLRADETIGVANTAVADYRGSLTIYDWPYALDLRAEWFIVDSGNVATSLGSVEVQEVTMAPGANMVQLPLPQLAQQRIMALTNKLRVRVGFRQNKTGAYQQYSFDSPVLGWSRLLPCSPIVHIGVRTVIGQDADSHELAYGSATYPARIAGVSAIAGQSFDIVLSMGGVLDNPTTVDVTPAGCLATIVPSRAIALVQQDRRRGVVE